MDPGGLPTRPCPRAGPRRGPSGAERIRPKLLEAVGDDILSVPVRTAAGKLIEIWLKEDPDDGAREVFAAFDAGFLGKAKWINAFGQEER